MSYSEQDIRETFRARVEHWYRVRALAVKDTLALSSPGVSLAAETAVRLANKYEAEMHESDGLDGHKVAAVIVCAALEHQADILKFIPGRHRYTVHELRLRLIIDLCATVFLSLLSCEDKQVEAEPKTLNGLRNLFTERKRISMYSLSLLAFLLEQAYPAGTEAPALTIAAA